MPRTAGSGCRNARPDAAFIRRGREKDMDRLFAEKSETPVVAFGDSITEGVIGCTPEENWLNRVQHALGDRVRMFNAGVGGNSAREAMARFRGDVLSRNPRVVLLEFGGNNHDPRNRARRVGDDEFRKHLSDFKRDLPEGCRVVVITFPPIVDEWHAYGTHPDFPDGLDKAMDPQREIVRTFARDNRYVLLDLYRLMDKDRKRLIQRDGVHLNPAGQKVFCEAVLKIFATMSN